MFSCLAVREPRCVLFIKKVATFMRETSNDVWAYDEDEERSDLTIWLSVHTLAILILVPEGRGCGRRFPVLMIQLCWSFEIISCRDRRRAVFPCVPSTRGNDRSILKHGQLPFLTWIYLLVNCLRSTSRIIPRSASVRLFSYKIWYLHFHRYSNFIELIQET